MRTRYFLLILILLLSLLACLSCANSSNDSDDSSDDTSDDDDDDNDDNDDDDNNDDNDNDDDNDDDTYPGTKYPIVLMHGFFGWGEAGPLSYFSGVVDDLTALGFDVAEPMVSPINSMEVRATQWEQKIQEIHGDQKINIIAHSQGGLDARYMISTLGWGDRVASVVMISVPNQGTSLADVVVGLVPGFAEDIIDWIMNLFGLDWDGFSQLTRDYVRNTFNPANPDDPNVVYYSYQTDAADNRIFLLDLSWNIIRLFDGANDGVVPTDSGRYGTELGVISADHWSIIGQPAGLSNFDHKLFYRDIANFLKAEGF